MEKHLQGEQEDIVFSEDSISVFFYRISAY